MSKSLILIAFSVITFSFLAFGEEYYLNRNAVAIVPNKILTVPIYDACKIEICERSAGYISKGTLLARINSKELDLEEAELKNRQRINLVESEEKILLLQRKKEELEFILEQPKEQRAFMEERFQTKADKKAIEQLDDKITILKESTRLSNEKLVHEFNNRKETRVMVMPFDGKIQYHITLTEEAEQLITQPGPLFTAIDDSSLFIVINMKNVAFTQLPHHKLILKLDLGGGKNISAKWSHKKIEIRNERETLVYYFEVPAKDRESALAMMGTGGIGELYYKGDKDENIQYISKSFLAEKAGSKSFETWEDLISALYPEHQILFTGETHLGLIPKRTD